MPYIGVIETLNWPQGKMQDREKGQRTTPAPRD